jgi:GNAT superfamily N-acetyltransferase
MAELRQVTPLEWETLRQIRLQALQEAPHAFGSTYEREATYSDEDWLALIDRGAWFIAWEAHEPTGLVAGVAPQDGPEDQRLLISLWVRADQRGRGTSMALVGAVAEWATRSGATVLTLWVTEGNDRAWRFYENAGFLPSGREQLSPKDGRTIEHELALML